MHDTATIPTSHSFDADIHSFADQFILWSIRKWVAGHRGSPTALALLESAYARTRTADAVIHLNALMRAITAGASRRIAVHAPCCPAISTDELLMIDAVALAQAEMKVDVAFLLRRFLTAAGARAAADPLRTLARTLRDSGLRLTVRSAPFPVAGGSVPYGTESTSLH
jgi:hypothetical protein